jgi:prophage antirepressor-like protein
MDIIRIFRDVGLKCDMTVNIQGTPDDPLFQASQIGELLDISDICSTVWDFDADEKVVHTVGSQLTFFLTELGLSRLVSMSRAPFARSFQKWVTNVAKNIRLAGKYEMEQRLITATYEHQVALDSVRHQLEDRDAVVAARDAEIAKIQIKTYEELVKLDNVYINKEVAELASDAHKIGRTIHTSKREAQLNTGSAQGSRMIYKRATVNAKIVEDIVKVAQRRYHIASIGGVEHYSNIVEHSVDVIDISATVVDTLTSSYEHMPRRELLGKVIAKLKALEEDGDGGDAESDHGGDAESDHRGDDESDHRGDDESDHGERNAPGRKMPPLHTCPTCGFVTAKKSTLVDHLQRKKSCKSRQHRFIHMLSHCQQQQQPRIIPSGRR